MRRWCEIAGCESAKRSVSSPTLSRSFESTATICCRVGSERAARQRRSAAKSTPSIDFGSYSCGDLFLQETLLEASLAALRRLAKATEDWNLIVSVGAPLVVDHLLFNCAVTIYQGRAVAVTPKAFPPNYREFYELRWFRPACDAHSNEVSLLGARAAFGTDVLVQAAHLPGFVLHTDICEDIWTPV